jgi:hypothetical protein
VRPSDWPDTGLASASQSAALAMDTRIIMGPPA